MNQQAKSRDEIRTALFAAKKGKSQIVQLFGVDIELRQPTLGSILEAREDADEKTRTTDVFIRYAYVPGTNERVFQEEDRDQILNWPFNEDIIRLQEVIAELTGVDLGAAKEELQADPLEDSS